MRQGWKSVRVEILHGCSVQVGIIDNVSTHLASREIYWPLRDSIWRPIEEHISDVLWEDCGGR